MIDQWLALAIVELTAVIILHIMVLRALREKHR